MVLAKFEIGTRLATVIVWTEVRVKQNDFYSFSFRRLEIQHGYNAKYFNTLRTGSFKLFKRPLPGFLTILTL